MASSLCNIVYVDKRALRDRLQTHSGRDETGLLTFAAESSSVIDAEAKEVQVNLQTLLSMVSEGKRTNLWLRGRSETEVYEVYPLSCSITLTYCSSRLYHRRKLHG